MGISRDFFSKPIPIPIRLIDNTVNDDNTVNQKDVNILFYLSRETNKQRGEYEMAKLVNIGKESEVRLARFANLLTDPPEGRTDFRTEFEGFSEGEEPLKERALEYFAGEK